MKTNLLKALIIFIPYILFSQSTTNYGVNTGQIGNDNSFFGFNAGKNNQVDANTFVGSNSGIENISGVENSFFGYMSGSKHDKGRYNLYVGSNSGSNNTNGNANVFLGAYSGLDNLGDGNVFIGYFAGSQYKGSYRLFIDNSNTLSPLIYGEFDKNILGINGKLNVGGMNPYYMLDVAGEVAINHKAIANYESSLNLLKIGDIDYSGFQTAFFDEVSNEVVRITKGRVGILTPTPDAALAVNGKIHAKEVKVDLNNWPDYVFLESYELMPLLELENFISKYHHLKNVPSEKEVIRDGVMLGEMNKILLEKVEELTLYTIQQQKELNLLKENNALLSKELEVLNNKVLSILNKVDAITKVNK